MTETKTVPAGLYAALAKVQAELPHIDAKAKAPIRGGRMHHYAGLDAVSAKVLPLLGKHGLAFTSRPTLIDGRFVLAYSLTHSGGEHIDGEYPLPGGADAHAIGSAITYGRRYALCAVTGVAPGGEDDDGAAAMEHTAGGQQGNSWENAKPAARSDRQQPQAPPDGSEWETAKPASEPVTDMDWMSHLVDDLIPAAKDTDTLNDYWAEINQHVDEGKCTPAHAKEIKAFIRERGQELGFTSKQPEPDGKQPEEVPA